MRAGLVRAASHRASSASHAPGAGEKRGEIGVAVPRGGGRGGGGGGGGWGGGRGGRRGRVPGGVGVGAVVAASVRGGSLGVVRAARVALVGGASTSEGVGEEGFVRAFARLGAVEVREDAIFVHPVGSRAASRITRDARYSSWRALAAEYPPDMSRWSARVDLPASRRPVTRAGQGGGVRLGTPHVCVSLVLLQILAPRITATSAISVIRTDEPANRRTRWRPPRRPSHGSLALTSSAEDAVDHRVLVASPSPPPAPPRWNPPRPTTRSSSSSSATAS